MANLLKYYSWLAAMAQIGIAFAQENKVSDWE
jgi:hypothetical protein